MKIKCNAFKCKNNHVGICHKENILLEFAGEDIETGIAFCVYLKE